MAGEPSWFEVGVGDIERGRAFYGALFGWTFATHPEGGSVIGTPGLPGGLHGGDPGATSMVFYAIDDMDAALTKVAELGGAHIPIPEADGDAALGRFAICRDDQGSVFGLHQRPTA